MACYEARITINAHATKLDPTYEKGQSSKPPVLVMDGSDERFEVRKERRLTLRRAVETILVYETNVRYWRSVSGIFLFSLEVIDIFGNSRGLSPTPALLQNCVMARARCPASRLKTVRHSIFPHELVIQRACPTAATAAAAFTFVVKEMLHTSFSSPFHHSFRLRQEHNSLRDLT